MQKTIFIGRLGKDAEQKTISGTEVINFSVGVTDTWKDKTGQKQSKTTWYECAKWGSAGILPYLKKGTQVFVEGVPTADAYTNKDGQAVGVLRIKVNQIELMGGGNAEAATTQKANVEASQEEPDLPF